MGWCFFTFLFWIFVFSLLINDCTKNFLSSTILSNFFLKFLIKLFSTNSFPDFGYIILGLLLCRWILSINPNFSLIGFVGWEHRHVSSYSEISSKRYLCNKFLFSLSTFMCFLQGLEQYYCSHLFVFVIVDKKKLLWWTCIVVGAYELTIMLLVVVSLVA